MNEKKIELLTAIGKHNVEPSPTKGFPGVSCVSCIRELFHHWSGLRVNYSEPLVLNEALVAKKLMREKDSDVRNLLHHYENAMKSFRCLSLLFFCFTSDGQAIREELRLKMQEKKDKNQA